MKVIRIYRPGDLRVDDVPVPKPGYGQALCRVRRAGICGTDYSIYTGAFSGVRDGRVNFPLQPGHEWSGEVVEIGEGVNGITAGTKVLGDTAVSCGECSTCRDGMYMRCESLRSVGTVNAWDGAMAEYVVFPVRHLIPVPDGVSLDQAALAEPAATAMYAVHHAPIRAGDSVAVFGTGPIGMAALDICRAYGAGQIISVGRNNKKLEWSKVFGADVVVNTRLDDPTESILDATDGKGVDVVIELSGAVELFKAGMKCVRRGGVLSVAAFYDQALEINPDDIVFGDITIKPVPGCFGMYDRLLHLIESGKISPEKMITQRCTLSEVQDCLDTYKKDNGNKIKIMIQMDNP